MLEEVQVLAGLGDSVVHQMRTFMARDLEAATSLKSISTVNVMADSSKSTDAPPTAAQFKGAASNSVAVMSAFS